MTAFQYTSVAPFTVSDANAHLNNPFIALRNIINGDIDAGNLAANAVGNSELAANAVTDTKVAAAAAIGVSKLAAGTDGAVLKTAAGAPAWSTVGSDGALLYNTGTDIAWTDAPADGEMLRAVGSVPTWVDPEVAYQEFVAPLSVTATTEAASQTVVDSGAVTYEAVPYLIEFFAPYVQPGSASGASVILSLWDGATDLGLLTSVQTPTAAAMIVPCRVERQLTPTAASHQYIVKAYRGGANGTVGAGAGGIAGFLPGFVRVTRV